MCICLLQAAHYYTRLQLGGLGWLLDCVQLCTDFRPGHLHVFHLCLGTGMCYAHCFIIMAYTPAMCICI